MFFFFADETSFTPTQLPDLQLWLDSADSSTIIESGGTVSQWNDKSIQGNDVVAVGDPQTNATTQNGLNVIDFDGLGDQFTATFGAGLSQPNTIFLVGALDNALSENYFIDGIVSGSRNSIFETVGMWTMFGGASLFGNASTTQFTIHTAVFNGTPNSALYENNGTPDTGDAGTNPLTGVTIGARFGGTNDLAGNIGEIIIYNRLLDTAEINAINTMLSNKWGIALA